MTFFSFPIFSFTTKPKAHFWFSIYFPINSVENPSNFKYIFFSWKKSHFASHLNCRSLPPSSRKEQNRHNCRKFMCLLSGENENEKKCRIPNAIQIINSAKSFFIRSNVWRDIFLYSTFNYIRCRGRKEARGNCSRELYKKITMSADKFLIHLMTASASMRENLSNFILLTFHFQLKIF